jgi:hypothetical protein
MNIDDGPDIEHVVNNHHSDNHVWFANAVSYSVILSLASAIDSGKRFRDF